MALCSESMGSSATGLRGGGKDQFARGDERLLVRQADVLAGFGGRVRRFQPRDPHDGRDDELHRRMRGYGDRPGRAVDDLDAAHAGARELAAELVRGLLGRQ